jgi:hypothetical protein
MNAIAGIQVFAWIAIAIVNTVLAWRYTWGLPLTEIPGTTPPAAVVVAVKNASDVVTARVRTEAPGVGIVSLGSGCSVRSASIGPLRDAPVTPETGTHR